MFIGKKPTDAPLTSSDVADGIITNAKLAQDIISGDTALASEPADTDEFLVSDAGTLKRIDYSLIKGGGIASASQFRLTTTFTGTADPIASNWEEADTDGYGGLGTAVSESSGIFTFPSTGIWWIISVMTHIEGSSAVQYALNKIKTTTDNSSYDEAAVSYNNNYEDGAYSTTSANLIFDVTSTSTHKVRIATNSDHSTTSTMGDTSMNRTYVTFIRLGDT